METIPLQDTIRAGVPLQDDKIPGDAISHDTQLTAEQRLASLLDAAHIIPWEADFRTSTFTFVGKPAEAVLGYPVADWYAPEFWASRLHPEDRDWAISQTEKLAWANDTFELEYRMIAKDGRTVWLYSLVNVQTDNGEPTFICGFS